MLAESANGLTRATANLGDPGESGASDQHGRSGAENVRMARVDDAWRRCIAGEAARGREHMRAAVNIDVW